MNVSPGACEIRVTLRNGRNLKLRPGRLEDKEKVAGLFSRLSVRSRYLRFGCMKSALSDAELACLTSSQPPDTLVYLASRGEGENERVVAVGGWFLRPDRTSAEIALLVEDDLQLRGVGTSLLENLAAYATTFGITRFFAYVLPENTKMQEVFDNSGFPLKRSFCEDNCEVVLKIDEEAEFLKRQAGRRHLASVAAVERILIPEGVAVFGGEQEASLASRILDNLLASPLGGRTYWINPRGRPYREIPGFSSLARIPNPVEVAVLIPPFSPGDDCLDQCLEKKVFCVVLLDAGEEPCLQGPGDLIYPLHQRALAGGVRVLSLSPPGLIGAPASFSLSRERLYRPGASGIISASPFWTREIVRRLGDGNLGVTQFVSMGDQIDVWAGDFLEFWEDHEPTKIIMLCLDTWTGGEALVSLCRRIGVKKPLSLLVRDGLPGGERDLLQQTGVQVVSTVADLFQRAAGTHRR